MIRHFLLLALRSSVAYRLSTAGIHRPAAPRRLAGVRLRVPVPA